MENWGLFWGKAAEKAAPNKLNQAQLGPVSGSSPLPFGSMERELIKPHEDICMKRINTVQDSRGNWEQMD